MKKLWLAVLWLLLVPSAALAAKGDMTLKAEGKVRSVCAEGNAFYMLLDGQAGVWQEGRMAFLPIAEEPGYEMLGGAVLPDGLHVLELVPRGETWRAEWSLLTRREDRFDRAVQAAFEWDALLAEDEEGNLYPRTVWRCVYGGDCFFMRSTVEEGEEEATYRLDLVTGRLTEVAGLQEDGWCLCPWENGLWLTLGEDAQGAVVRRYDPRDGSLDRLFALPEGCYPETMAWCEETKQLYLMENGNLTRCNVDGSALEEVCNLPLGHFYGDVVPVFFENGKFFAVGMTEGAVLRNVLPTQEERSVYTLRVYDESIDSMLDEAAEMSRRTLKAAPDNPIYLDTYAWIMFVSRQYDEAERVMHKVVPPDSTDEYLLDNKYCMSNVLEHAGDIAWMQGKEEEALRFWRLAMKRDDKTGTPLLPKKVRKKKYYAK